MERVARIHPSIGVARLGASTRADGFFIGPETPYAPVVPPDGFRDADGALKKQGARFRVFLQETSGAVRELALADATIEWTIEVANRKAAADRFHGIAEPNPGPRNAGFHQRELLVLSAPKASVSGPNQSVDLVNETKFMGFDLPVTMATAKTDSAGNLVVLGGFGKAGSPSGMPLNSPGSNFANHDGWFDDTCDGRVTANIAMRDGSSAPPVLPAWVLTAPPKFAPSVPPVVTLYDTLRQVAIDRGLLPNPFATAGFRPSFTRDIYPILARALAVRWLWAPDGDPSPVAIFHNSFTTIPPSARNLIFGKLRIPPSSPQQPGSGPGNMPRMWSDLYPNGKNGTITSLQHRMMQEWKDGNFIDDWHGVPNADPMTPEGLDRAALDACVGAAFYPGIEASWKLRDEFEFVEPFRLNASTRQPGDVTAQMSLPWQSDFLDCGVESGNFGQDLTWWPAQRPIDIRQRADGPPISWARAFDHPGDLQVEEMVDQWSRLGFVLPEGDALLERDRH
jgi:hypothetical protein